MFAQIGEHRPRYFAVLDLTSGYHQVEVANPSRALTAFITTMGIFQFKRLPMGLKGAPAYFQKMMSGIVLHGLVFSICEIYLDDCLVFGKTKDEFIDNLRQVLLRFRKYNLTCNPDKCRFGMSQVEYVGVQIDENGLSFSTEKKDSVMNFPKPEIQKQLKSFLGLANYFRTHVRNHSEIVRPLEGMLRDYHRSRKLVWSEIAIAAFEAVKVAIHECQTLSFLDEKGDIHFKSDASYYGIGVYLAQIVDDKEQPISFLSKTLSKEQLNWKVPEKECYAIWFGLKKLEYLIRDVRFTLHTDHRNLTFLKTAGSDKVMRWKLEIQEYDCKVIFIKGEDNHIADAFSRLCAIETENEEENLCLVAKIQFYVSNKVWKVIEQCHNAKSAHGGGTKNNTPFTN